MTNVSCEFAEKLTEIDEIFSGFWNLLFDEITLNAKNRLKKSKFSLFFMNLVTFDNSKHFFMIFADRVKSDKNIQKQSIQAIFMTSFGTFWIWRQSFLSSFE